MSLPPPPFQAAKTSGLAICSLVLGILSLTCFSILTGIPAVVCGHISLSRIKQAAGMLTGRGLALAGLITGYISIALSFVMIPLMLAIAIPNFVKARGTAQTNACINNLRQIEGAKEQWALENRKDPGSPVDQAAVNRFIKNGGVTCPAGGSYTYGPTDTLPQCSIPGHSL